LWLARLGTVIYARLMARLIAMTLAWTISLAGGTAALGQAIAPLRVDGPAQAALRQLRPPPAIEQVREQSMRRAPALPVPAPAPEQWVPARRVFASELGREVVIPGHFERRVSDQQYVSPPLFAYDVATGLPVALPGGAGLWAPSRQGP